MELSKFLNLCGIVFGGIAAIFLSKVLFVRAEKILRGTIYYSSLDWPPIQLISDKAGQKSDTLASIFLILLALFLQACAMFVSNDVYVTNDWNRDILIGVMLVVVVTVFIHFFDIGMKRYFETKIKKRSAKDYIKHLIEKRSVPSLSGVQAIAEEYFDIKKEAKEENIDFVKRFVAFLKYDMPANADFSKFI